MKTYEVFSATAIGDSHIRKGIRREDNVGDLETDNYKLIAVSDGHGDPNCFRSAKGSEIAVRICLEGLRTFAEHFLYDASFRKNLEIRKYRDEAVTRLMTGIEAQWNLQVQAHLENCPINYAAETAGCDPDKIKRYQSGQKLKNIYGATLIGAAIFENRMLIIQLGDGKAVCLESDGSFVQPVPLDPKCRGNITTSLCDEDALQSFRVYLRGFQEGDPPLPLAVMLTSDGIEDSYRTDDLMYCFHRDLCIETVQRGIAGVKTWYEQEALGQISRNGSGDDMSVAAVLDVSRICPLIPQMQQQNQEMSLQEDARYYLERMQSMEMKRKFLRRDLEKAEAALHGTNAKLLPNSQVITNYQAEKQRCEKALSDLAAVTETRSREKISREKEIDSLRSQIVVTEGKLAESMKMLEELRDSDGAQELAEALSRVMPEALGQAEDHKGSEEKVKASLAHRCEVKQGECDALCGEIETLLARIETLQTEIAKFESDLQKAAEGKAVLEAQITGLDEKINTVISENQRLSGDSHSKEQIYAKKKQEWLDYEEKYKAYEAKYNALMKKK